MSEMDNATTKSELLSAESRFNVLAEKGRANNVDIKNVFLREFAETTSGTVDDENQRRADTSRLAFSHEKNRVQKWQAEIDMENAEKATKYNEWEGHNAKWEEMLENEARLEKRKTARSGLDHKELGLRNAAEVERNLQRDALPFDVSAAKNKSIQSEREITEEVERQEERLKNVRSGSLRELSRAKSENKSESLTTKTYQRVLDERFDAARSQQRLQDSIKSNIESSQRSRGAFTPPESRLKPRQKAPISQGNRSEYGAADNTAMADAFKTADKKHPKESGTTGTSSVSKGSTLNATRKRLKQRLKDSNPIIADAERAQKSTGDKSSIGPLSNSEMKRVLDERFDAARSQQRVQDSIKANIESSQRSRGAFTPPESRLKPRQKAPISQGNRSEYGTADNTAMADAFKTARNRLKQKMHGANPVLVDALLDQMRNHENNLSTDSKSAADNRDIESDSGLSVSNAIDSVMSDIKKAGDDAVSSLPKAERLKARGDLTKAEKFVKTKLRMTMDKERSDGRVNQNEGSNRKRTADQSANDIKIEPAQIKKSEARTPQNTKKTSAGEQLDALGKKLSKSEQEALADIAAFFKKQKGTINSGLDPEIVMLVAKLGAIKLSQGAVSFAQWANEMLAATRGFDIPDEDVKPIMKASYGSISYDPERYGISDDIANNMDDPRRIRNLNIDDISAALDAKIKKKQALALMEGDSDPASALSWKSNKKIFKEDMDGDQVRNSSSTPDIGVQRRDIDGVDGRNDPRVETVRTGNGGQTSKNGSSDGVRGSETNAVLGDSGSSGENNAANRREDASKIGTPLVPRQKGTNYHIKDPASLLGGTPKKRFRRNKVSAP